MQIDELGFIHTVFNSEEISQFAKSQLSYSMSNPTMSKANAVRKLRNRNNCWICEGWREFKFTFTPSGMKKDELVEVKLHLDLDDYYPTETHYKNGVFQVYRMCPPSEISYFFTINNKVYVSEDQLPLNNKINIQYEEEFEDEQVKTINLEITHVNTISNPQKNRVIDEPKPMTHKNNPKPSN